MNIQYTEEKIFTAEQVEELFLSVKWISGKYPDRLYRALLNSSTVITAWDNKRLVGLVRVLDDGGMVAYIHYVLVHPDYHKNGIAGTMIKQVKEKYKNYLYLEVMPEESKNATFYERFGFQVMKDGVAMQISNYIIYQSLLPALIACIHSSHLGDCFMRLINNKKKIILKIIHQCIRRLSRSQSGQMSGIIFDS